MRNHILHTFHFRFTVFVQHSQARILVDFLAFFHFLDGSRSNDLDALFAFFDVTVELILPCVKPCHQCGIRPLHSDQQRIIEAVIVEFCHRAQIRRVHFRCKNVLYALLQPFRDFFHLLFAVNCHASPPFFLTHRVFIWRGYWSACFGAFAPFHSKPPALPSQVYPAAFRDAPFSVSRM